MCILCMNTDAVSGDVEWGGSFLFMGFVVPMLAMPMFVYGGVLGILSVV